MLHSTLVETLGEMACAGGGRVAIGGWRCIRVDASHRRRCGRCCWERRYGEARGGDTHADISPTSRQATAMYGIQVRISTVKDAHENRMQLLTSCCLRLPGALVVSAPMSSRASRVIGSASGSGSPRTASTHSMLPPTWLSYRSTSVATHQALSAGHQMFGGPGQK